MRSRLVEACVHQRPSDPATTLVRIHAELVERGGLYARLYQQQFQGGEVEAECEDGVVLATGEIVRTSAAK